jgi:tetrapyrrole methylase family protein / MazG family protein
MKNSGITIVGLGPGGGEKLTLEAWKHLHTIDTIYLRTNLIPIVADLPAGLKVESFDHLFQENEPTPQALEEIVSTLLKLGQGENGVTYGVPGSPMVAEETVKSILDAARQTGLEVRIIDGMSFLEPVCQALGIVFNPVLTIADGLALTSLLVPSFPPTQPALITQITTREMASEIKLTLMANYPDEFKVTLAHAVGTDSEKIENIALWELDHSPFIGPLSSLYMPAREAGRSLEDFQEIIARLRAPDGCPWDKEQTHLSLRPYLLEEAYEVLEALDDEDAEHLKEELGDLLLQIVLHTQIAMENADFNMTDVLDGISQKFIRRHPHVFGSVQANTSAQIVKNWEQIKAEERKTNGDAKPKGMLDGIPSVLPALVQADQIQDRAKRVGFDWQTFAPVVDKVREELGELLDAKTSQEQQGEAGDLLFACVNVIRWLNVDPEMALRETNRRFRRRFAYIEAKAAEQGKTLQELGFEAMNALWNEAKHVFAQEGKS